MKLSRRPPKTNNSAGSTLRIAACSLLWRIPAGNGDETVKKDEVRRSCADCVSGACGRENGNHPPFCLTEEMDGEILGSAMELYSLEENRAMAVAAAEVEAENYCKMTRVEEIMEFARKIGAGRIGIASCVGLKREAATAARIFRAHGFQVFGVCCKAGEKDKTEIGIPEKCMAVGRHMCNPILQAKMLAREKTGLNVIIGLCVGHDCLFSKYSEAPVTTLVAKDRVLGHNPAAALYQAEAYYSRLLENGGEQNDQKER